MRPQLPGKSYGDTRPIKHIPIDPLEKLAEGHKQRPYAGYQRLKEEILSLHDSTRGQYLVFTRVPETAISNIRKDMQIGKSRFFYHRKSATLILKVPCSYAYALISGELIAYINVDIFALNLETQMNIMNSFDVEMGDWIKQADGCWAPSGVDTSLSLIIKVDFSESSRNLALIAQSWIETAGSSVGVAITVNADSSKPVIVIDRWERTMRPILATSTQQIIIDRQNNTTVASADLTLPFHKIVGRPPNPESGERDFIIRQQVLQKIAEKAWRELGLL
ncbi:hypothetical protein F5884DRAFT_355141 [Xylogone sp. PMI_703]|nr:hypothetical protein F5884DRAFT_355141 [Xylogone sp. PMI_703]